MSAMRAPACSTRVLGSLPFAGSDFCQPGSVDLSLINGRIVISGGAELAHELEAKGYQWVKDEFGEAELLKA